MAVQLSLIENKEKSIENEFKIEEERTLKKQIHLQFHMLYEQKKRLDKQEALIESLIDYILA